MLRALKITVPLVLLLAVTALTGCGTMRAYSGEALAPDQVAIIKPSYTSGAKVYILSVDQRDLEFGSDKIEVLPGHHTITAKVMVSNGAIFTNLTGTMKLTFSAVAGHTYELVSVSSGGGLFTPPTKYGILLQDADSGMFVTSAEPNSR